MIEANHLRVSYGTAPAVRDVSFCIAAGEAVGLVGESGCGKSTTALAMMGLLRERASVSGSVLFRGQDLLGLPESDLQSIRGADVSLVFQEPHAAINPVMRIRRQIEEVLRAHHQKRDAMQVLARVGLSERIARAYPHQLSGGQLQRVLIAQALACGPAVLLADEPTSSLDRRTQADILELLKRLQADAGLAMLLITHQPAILTGLASRIFVMYAGQIVESGSLNQVYSQPLHPYTQALLRCIPPPRGTVADRRLPAISGEPPEPARLPLGCAFAPRCAQRRAECIEREPPLLEIGGDRQVRCVLYE